MEVNWSGATSEFKFTTDGKKRSGRCLRPADIRCALTTACAAAAQILHIDRVSARWHRRRSVTSCLLSAALKWSGCCRPVGVDAEARCRPAGRPASALCTVPVVIVIALAASPVVHRAARGPSDRLTVREVIEAAHGTLTGSGGHQSSSARDRERERETGRRRTSSAGGLGASND